MHILVTAASKHGATDEVADAIAKRIEASGITVDRLAPADVTSVEGYDAVIVGSAVYILQWMPEAHDFMERFKDDLPVGQVWAFSVGMNGVPKHSEQDGTRVARCSHTCAAANCTLSRAVTSPLCCPCVSVPSRVWPALLKATSVTGTPLISGLTRLSRLCRADAVRC